MAWGDWLDLSTIKVLSQHTSATLAAIFSFWIVSHAVSLTSLSIPAKVILDTTEEVGLIGMVLWLLIQAALVLWKGRFRNYVFVVA